MRLSVIPFDQPAGSFLLSAMNAEDLIKISKANPRKFDNISLEYYGSGDSFLALGNLKGNAFEITIRNIDSLPESKTQYVNYYGEQRFSRNNHDIGNHSNTMIRIYSSVIAQCFISICRRIGNSIMSDSLSTTTKALPNPPFSWNSLAVNHSINAVTGT